MQRNRAGPKSPNLPNSTLLKTMPQAAGKKSICTLNDVADRWPVCHYQKNLISMDAKKTRLLSDSLDPGSVAGRVSVLAHFWSDCRTAWRPVYKKSSCLIFDAQVRNTFV